MCLCVAQWIQLVVHQSRICYGSGMGTDTDPVWAMGTLIAAVGGIVYDPAMGAWLAEVAEWLPAVALAGVVGMGAAGLIAMWRRIKSLTSDVD